MVVNGVFSGSACSTEAKDFLIKLTKTTFSDTGRKPFAFFFHHITVS